VPLATALCKNLPAENTQRELSRAKPTRVAVPIEEEEEDEEEEEEEEEDRSIPTPILEILKPRLARRLSVWYQYQF